MILQRIIDYNLVEAAFASKLIERVKVMLEEDWQPLGASYFACNSHYQAMVKHGYMEMKQDTPGRIATPGLRPRKPNG